MYGPRPIPVLGCRFLFVLHPTRYILYPMWIDNTVHHNHTHFHVNFIRSRRPLWLVLCLRVPLWPETMPTPWNLCIRVFYSIYFARRQIISEFQMHRVSITEISFQISIIKRRLPTNNEMVIYSIFQLGHVFLGELLIPRSILSKFNTGTH